MDDYPIKYTKTYELLLARAGQEWILPYNNGFVPNSELLKFRIISQERLEHYFRYRKPRFINSIPWFCASSIYFGQGYHVELFVNEDLSHLQIVFDE